MGWASATDLFDGAVDVALVFAPKIPQHLASNKSSVPEAIVRAVVREMYTQVDWDDWDTQDESKYFKDHLIHVMYDLGEIDEEYWNEFI